MIIFEFEFGKHTIHVKGASFTGLEEIYLDNELVSRKRQFKRSSSHQIDVGLEKIDVEILVSSMFQGRLSCCMKKEGEVLAAKQAKPVMGFKLSIIFMVIVVPLFFAVGAAKVYFALPAYVDIFVAAGIILALWFSSKYIDWEITDNA